MTLLSVTLPSPAVPREAMSKTYAPCLSSAVPSTLSSIEAVQPRLSLSAGVTSEKSKEYSSLASAAARVTVRVQYALPSAPSESTTE